MDQCVFAEVNVRGNMLNLVNYHLIRSPLLNTSRIKSNTLRKNALGGRLREKNDLDKFFPGESARGDSFLLLRPDRSMRGSQRPSQQQGIPCRQPQLPHTFSRAGVGNWRDIPGNAHTATNSAACRSWNTSPATYSASITFVGEYPGPRVVHPRCDQPTPRIGSPPPPPPPPPPSRSPRSSLSHPGNKN